MQSLLRVGSLKFRITVVVAICSLFTSSLVAIVALTLAEHKMMAVVGDQQYTLLASVASNIDEDLESKRSILKILGEALAGAGIRDGARVQQFLEQRGTMRDEFSNVVALDASGRLVGNLADRRAIGAAGFDRRDYFKRTVAAHEGVTSAPFKSVLSGKPVILVTEPVYDENGALLFILGGGINLESPRFFGQLPGLKPGTSGYLFAMTTDGVIIHHPKTARILVNVKDEEGGTVPATDAALKGFEGWVEGASKQGVSSLIAYKRLRSVDWLVGSVYPVEEAFTPLIDMRRKALVASVLIAVVTALAAWFAVLRLLRPLGALRRHASSIAEGSTDISVFDVDRKDEFGDLSRAFHLLSARRQQAEAELAVLAQTDTLTGLNNRRMLEQALAAALARSARSGAALAVAYLDVDHFKSINDSFGHECGDAVLVEFARRLLATVRVIDKVARLGGDEFVVVFEQLAGIDEAHVLGAKIVEVMHAPITWRERTIHITTSAGIAVSLRADESVSMMLAKADGALYEAKRAGRDRYAVHVDGQ